MYWTRVQNSWLCCTYKVNRVDPQTAPLQGLHREDFHPRDAEDHRLSHHKEAITEKSSCICIPSKYFMDPQHRTRNNSRSGHSNTHDTREGSSQKRIHGATISFSLEVTTVQSVARFGAGLIFYFCAQLRDKIFVRSLAPTGLILVEFKFIVQKS